MSTTTTNYGLIKPDTTDPILIGQLNDNADVIDAALKENADAIENKPDAADIPTPSTAAPAMDGTAAAGTSTDYARADHVHPSDTSKQDSLTTAQLDAVNSGINSAKVSQIETNKNNISSLAAELHALLPNITSSTTIRDYVDSLSRGVYTAFIANVSNPSDSPINANCFVNIYVYSATSMAVELIPLAVAEMSRTYTMRKVAGTWREWYMVEGTPVASSTQS